ncbi:MAG: hypothetical protein ACXAC5_23005 [Promethearchaeota archaeon]|jgi:hypothetical protein
MTDKEEEKDYHGVAPIRSIVKRMKKDYDKDSKDWRVIGSKDRDGNSDTIISKKPNHYWLKSKQLSPFSALSMGSVVRNLDRDIDEKMGKRMSPNEMLRFFGMVVPVKADKNIIAAGIEKYSQEQGDYLKKVIKERDSNLDYQLRHRIDKEFTKKYPQRKNLFI